MVLIKSLDCSNIKKTDALALSSPDQTFPFDSCKLTNPTPGTTQKGRGSLPNKIILKIQQHIQIATVC